MDKEQFLQLYREYNSQITEIAKKQEALVKEFTERFCPYKVDDKIEYIGAYNNKAQFGIIQQVRFELNDKSIDKMWYIYVLPTTKNFVPIVNRYSYHLGNYDGGKIIKVIK